MPVHSNKMGKLFRDDEEAKSDEEWKKRWRKKSTKNEIKVQKEQKSWRRSHSKINSKERRWLIWRSWNEFQERGGIEEKQSLRGKASRNSRGRWWWFHVILWNAKICSI